MYKFENNRLVIKEPALNLDFDEPFSPHRIPSHPQHGMEVGDSLLLIKGDEISIEKRGVRNGEFRIHYPSGKLKHQCYYLDGLLHGPSTIYSEEGQILSATWYIRGKKAGMALLWYPSGALYSRQTFFDGIWDGVQEYYHPDGSVKTQLLFINGLISGKPFINPAGTQ